MSAEIRKDIAMNGARVGIIRMNSLVENPSVSWLIEVMIEKNIAHTKS